MFFFFFKQKTAYEIGVRLVGSEMCIRDRSGTDLNNFCLDLIAHLDEVFNYKKQAEQPPKRNILGIIRPSAIC